MDIKIQSDRISLRRLHHDDLQDMYELDSDAEVHKYLGKNPVTTLEQSKNIIQSVLDQYKKNNIGRLAIIDNKSKAFIGWAGLKWEEKVRSEFSYYDVGYRLKRKHWGQGYGTEAAQLSLKYGFENLKLEKICGAADVNNIGSNRILSKIGMEKKDPFEYEGVTCNWYEIMG